MTNNGNNKKRKVVVGERPVGEDLQDLEITISQDEREDLEKDISGDQLCLLPPPPSLPVTPPSLPVAVVERGGEHLLRWDPSVNSFITTNQIDSIFLDRINFNWEALKAIGRSLTPCSPYQTGHCGKSSFIHYGRGAYSSKEFAHCCLVCYRISGLPLLHNLIKCPHTVA